MYTRNSAFKEFLLHLNHLCKKYGALAPTDLSWNKIPDIKEFFVDGTFYNCPAPFSQLYNIHGDIRSTSETTEVAPLIFALMSDRIIADLMFGL